MRSAIALSAEQNVRLASALSALQGRQVRLNVLVDPAVVGGIVVRVGDDVIDGSVVQPTGAGAPRRLRLTEPARPHHP